MNIKRRLERIERQGKPGRWENIPWVLSDDNTPTGIEIDGEVLTWDEIREQYPDAPKPLRWSDGPSACVSPIPRDRSDEGGAITS